MGIDLTRFDWNALNFSKSEAVQRMTAEEVGQYVLLLNESWLMAKAASLPNDLDFLARIARTKKVSDIILDKFPAVETEWGIRRRNSTLYREWLICKERSESGRKAAELRWDKGSQSERNATAYATAYADACNPQCPSQAKISQAKPNQESVSFGGGVFKNISARYSSYMGVSHSHARKHIEKYQQACEKFGEDRVLSAFNKWAKDSDWLKDRKDAHGLNLFWRPMEDIIVGEELTAERNKPVEKKEVKTYDPVQYDLPENPLTPEQKQEKMFQI